MPTGKIHNRLWKRYLLPASVISTLIGYFIIKNTTLSWWTFFGFAMFFGYLLGYYVDPDYDQGKMTAGRRKLSNHMGFLGHLIILWFTPYEMVFKHRSKYTHVPILSTSIRLFWLLAFPPIALALWFTTPGVIPGYYPILIGVLAGLSLADSIHFLADYGVIHG